MDRPRDRAQRILHTTFLTPVGLAELGIDRHRASTLVRRGALLRLRNGRYAEPGLAVEIEQAARLGGRLDCVSLLAALGVFVRVADGLHVQFEPGTTRLPRRGRDVVSHWRSSRRGREQLTADVVEALAQACRCQTPRDAIATLDSAWHHGIVGETDLVEIFRRLPKRYQVLRKLLDRRCESGSESILRLILRTLGAHHDVQVSIDGVGRVDFVVDGWLIVECDSEAHHSDWASQRRDRRRDIAAAARGYTTVRPIAEDILFHPEQIADELRAILSQGPRMVRRHPGKTPRIRDAADARVRPR